MQKKLEVETALELYYRKVSSLKVFIFTQWQVSITEVPHQHAEWGNLIPQMNVGYYKDRMTKHTYLQPQRWLSEAANPWGRTREHHISRLEGHESTGA